MPQDRQKELEREVADLRQKVEEQRLRIRRFDEQLRIKEETLRWIFSSRVYRFSQGICKGIDKILLPLQRLRRTKSSPPTSQQQAELCTNGEEHDADDEPLDRPLQRTLPPAASFDVIRLPIIDWDFRFQRPQQLMRELAREGHRTFYVRNRFHEAHSDIEIGEIAEGIAELTLPGPAQLSVYTEQIDDDLLELFFRAFDRLRRSEAIHQAAVIVDLPFWEPLAQELRRRFGWKLIYDCMDEHAGFSTNTKQMLAHEESLLSSSDLVLTTAKVLTERARKHNDSVSVIPNAGEYDHFATGEPHEFYKQLSSSVIGYYGAIADWFDDAMIANAARLRPDWDFVLIGSTGTHDVSSLEGLANVHLLGEKPYDELPRWVHGFDIACIPFKDNELTRATNPVKFFEYMSAGKPVVSTPLCELEPYEGSYYPASDGKSFVEAAERALAESADPQSHSQLLALRRQIGRENTWKARGLALHAAICGLYPKAAIIIISYHNLEILQQCLESVWSNTHYPDFEVIVVDNASGEEVTSWLRSEAKREPRLRVQFNQDNRGFAAANNQGIELASDAEYFILLNNDTIVPQGWLSRLLRYLDNPTIGLVGPVTSWAGNEARIPVPYEDPSGIEDFAYKHCAQHSDEHFDIRVLAMFCVAMRRGLIDAIGLLDERYGVGMFEDDDFSMRVRDAGYRCICAEDCFVHHWGEKSFKKLERPEYYSIFESNKAKFEDKWGEEWRAHVARDWNADSATPAHYAQFTRDLWVWSCPLCNAKHHSLLEEDTKLDCHNCGATPETRAAAVEIARVIKGRPVPMEHALRKQGEEDAAPRLYIEGLSTPQLTAICCSSGEQADAVLLSDHKGQVLQNPELIEKALARMAPKGVFALASPAGDSHQPELLARIAAHQLDIIEKAKPAFLRFGIKEKHAAATLLARG
ncbi:MAG: glycosyl transferase family 1 [Planctomycetota bacterium]|nr:MAG: glycosyl transferase family 1 [Planctomycetota bacterium]